MSQNTFCSSWCFSYKFNILERLIILVYLWVWEFENRFPDRGSCKESVFCCSPWSYEDTHRCIDLRWPWMSTWLPRTHRNVDGSDGRNVTPREGGQGKLQSEPGALVRNRPLPCHCSLKLSIAAARLNWVTSFFRHHDFACSNHVGASTYISLREKYVGSKNIEEL